MIAARETHSGSVTELWRYPVKSMLGERLATATLAAGGIEGDRRYAVRDLATGAILSAKRFPALFELRARHRDGGVEVLAADRAPLVAGSSELDELLSDRLGRGVSVARASDDERARVMMGEHSSSIEGPVGYFDAAPGTFFDSAEVHVLTTATLARLTQLYPAGAFDARRFRPNIVITPGAGEVGFVEETWAERRAKIGPEAVLEIMKPCRRCVMVTHAQQHLERDAGILQTVARMNDNAAGMLAAVAAPGRIAVGDVVTVV